MQLLCIIIFELKVILFRVKLCETFWKLVEILCEITLQWNLLPFDKSVNFGTGLNPNFSLRILSPTTVWILVSPSIWTKVKCTYYEILLYLDVRKMVVNSTIQASARNSVSFLFPTWMQLLWIIIFELKVILFRVKLCEFFWKLVELLCEISMKLIAIWEIWKFRNNRGEGIKLSWAILMTEANNWKSDKIVTIRRTRDINIFLVLISVKVVFQYKYWTPYTYKSCLRTRLET